MSEDDKPPEIEASPIPPKPKRSHKRRTRTLEELKAELDARDKAEAAKVEDKSPEIVSSSAEPKRSHKKKTGPEVPKERRGPRDRRERKGRYDKLDPLEASRHGCWTQSEAQAMNERFCAQMEASPDWAEHRALESKKHV